MVSSGRKKTLLGKKIVPKQQPHNQRAAGCHRIGIFHCVLFSTSIGLCSHDLYYNVFIHAIRPPVACYCVAFLPAVANGVAPSRIRQNYPAHPITFPNTTHNTIQPQANAEKKKIKRALSTYMAVGQKHGTQNGLPWQMETWTKTCGPLVV